MPSPNYNSRCRPSQLCALGAAGVSGRDNAEPLDPTDASCGGKVRATASAATAADVLADECPISLSSASLSSVSLTVSTLLMLESIDVGAAAEPEPDA